MLISEVNALRQDFVTQNPAPAKLSRAEKAARNVSAAGKKAREITQALEDAIKAEDEAVSLAERSNQRVMDVGRCHLPMA